MSTTENNPRDLTPERIESLIQAARAERAQAVHSFFKRLFHRKREAQAWPAANQAFTVNC